MRPVGWERLAGVSVPLAAAVCVLACGGPEEFRGTALSSGDRAAGFDLTNQFGGRVTLAEYVGSPVLLTFLYTDCPDVCPLTAVQLRQTLDLLGEDAAGVRVAAVSVDPERDTPEAAMEFSDRWGMTEDWDFLVGSRETLEPLWRAYYVDPVVDGGAASGSKHRPVTGGGTGSLRQSFEDRYLVIHSNPVYLLDAEGVMRVVFTSPLEPDDIAHDVRLLLD